MVNQVQGITTGKPVGDGKLPFNNDPLSINEPENKKYIKRNIEINAKSMKI